MGRFDEALALCERLESECADEHTATAFRAAIYLNTGVWAAAAQAAQRSGGDLAPAQGFIEAFAQLERGEPHEALAAYLRAALHYPRAASMLAGVRTSVPKSGLEAEDHNVGVHETRSLHAYLKGQSRGSRKFFRAAMSDPRVVRLLEELAETQRRWHASRGTVDRTDFDRMMQMRKREFARAEADKLADLLGTREAKAALH